MRLEDKLFCVDLIKGNLRRFPYADLCGVTRSLRRISFAACVNRSPERRAGETVQKMSEQELLCLVNWRIRLRQIVV